MNWKILNVSIPVNDFKKSIAFYEMLLGRLEFSNEVFIDIFENNEDYFFGNNGFGLRLFKPKPDLLLNGEIQSRRSFVTILVENIGNIIENLKQSRY